MTNERLLDIVATLRRIGQSRELLADNAIALEQAASEIETMVVDSIANAPPIMSKATADQRTAQRLAGALALLEAVQFYADPATYFAIVVIPDRPCGDFVNDSSVLSEDEKTIWDDYRGGGDYFGKRAREALAACRLSDS